jgi:hypothetical protein
MLRTLGSGKTFFIRYLSDVIEKEGYPYYNNKMCMLNSKASTVHNTFHIQCKGYVRPLQELSVEFQILKEANIIIIDEMSMMTSTLLQNIKIKL